MITQAKLDSDQPQFRPLKAYAFDPTRGRAQGNFMTIEVPYEPLTPGPTSKYLTVVDYDASNDCYYPPVDLDSTAILLRGGLGPSESDPRFHQQMVYAVVTETIKRFEFALGREPRWHRSFSGDRLRIFPHAVQQANAFYSRDLRALVFGYFKASDTEAGANLPGQVVFTCLSHDVVAHETTHALIDGQKEYFMEPTGPDTAAFHEAFADIVALFQHFSYKDALLDVIQQTGGLIYRTEVAPEASPVAGGPRIQAELSTDNPLVELARQFGEALGMRAALRGALGTPPNSRDLEHKFEPHERGAILVAAVFDAFFSVYLRRTRDLMRIARAGGGLVEAGDLHPDLANRLATEATKAAEHFGTICIRALDYCPPIDVRFGDFLRAMITADFALVPDDQYGYRAALIDAFRLRGIRPEHVTSYAEDSLLWCPPEEINGGIKVPRCEGLDFNPIKPPTKEQSEANARVLQRFGRDNAAALGLMPGVNVQAHSFHPTHRVGPDGHLRVEVVVELMQQRPNVPLDPGFETLPRFTFRGGATLVLDLDGNVLFAIVKPLGQDDGANDRLRRQREYFRQLDFSFAPATYLDARLGPGAGGLAGRPLSLLDRAGPQSGRMRFDLIHRGY